jgi:serine/threonine protein kinase
MALGSMDDFLAVLDHSKLLKPEEFAEVQHLAQESPDPTALAKTLVRNDTLTRWQAGQLLAGRSKCTVGKYKLLELLGRGGMGSVYLGQHVMMNRRVALKIIPRHIGKDPAGLERFLAEARTIASLDHPNVVQAYSVDNEGDQYYLVMEYVEGLDLARLVEAEGPLDCASAVDYIRQAADGLAHAHTRNMVHCDIKPSNLIVNPQGVVKILDMGLARLTGEKQVNGETNDERILGTVDYMAPEQALHTADFNHRADIYALGCTLYFLLSGHPPFPEGTLPERILKHQTQEPRSLALERADVPQSLIEICRKMMAKRPADRFQTAGELSQVLAAWRPGEKRVQRVLQLKKAEPVDDLPGPNFLGTDLNELFRKGMGASATTPLVSRKPPSKLDSWPAPLRPLLSTPGRAIATIGISAAAVILIIVALITLFGKGSSPVALVQPPSPETPVKPDNTAGGTAPDSGKNDKGDTESTGTEPDGKKPKPPDGPPTAPPPPEQPDIKSDKPPEPDGGTKPSNPDGEPSETAKPVTPTQQDTPPATDLLPPTDTFKDLATVVELPEFPKSGSPENASNKNAVLGKVLLNPGASLQMLLIGGDKAIKGADSLVMVPSKQSPLWQVYLETASQDSGDPQHTEIAQFRLVAGNLLFKWMPKASAPVADALKYCGILAYAQGQRQLVQLCRPKQIDPLVVDLDSGVSRATLQLGAVPALANLRVQITDRDEAFPPNALQPSDNIDVKPEGESEVTLVFTEPRLADFKIRIAAEKSGQKLELKTTALYDIGDVQPTKITEPKTKVFKYADLTPALNEFNKKLPFLQAQFDKTSDGNPRKKDMAKGLEILKRGAAVLQEMDGLYQALNNKGKIQYRVFIVYGKYNKVEAFSTQPPVVQPLEIKEEVQTVAPQNSPEQQPKKPPKKTSSKKKPQDKP